MIMKVYDIGLGCLQAMAWRSEALISGIERS